MRKRQDVINTKINASWFPRLKLQKTTAFYDWWWTKKKNVRMYDLLCLGGFNQNQSFIVHVHSPLQKKKKSNLSFSSSKNWVHTLEKTKHGYATLIWIQSTCKCCTITFNAIFFSFTYQNALHTLHKQMTYALSYAIYFLSNFNSNSKF